jgi:hypothetical protein
MNEDKIAEIRAWVERRQVVRMDDCALSHFAEKGIVICGVPLNEEEIAYFRDLVIDHRSRFPFSWQVRYPAIAAIWEMLERGKK